MKKRYIINAALAFCCMTAQAQSMNEDYAGIGVYDTWEQSPFRTGELQGNVQVIKNHLYSASGVNRTGHILGIQRSRFGSNTFGACVTLKSPVTIGRNGKYVHALVYTPKASNVQIIGLGRRTTNTWNEGTDVEQFWSEPVTIRANAWTDIVAQVKTNENVEIHSIVVVPDCSSPHALTEDFVAYIDEIVVNTSSSKRSSVTATADPYEEGGDGPEIPDDPSEDEEYYKTNFSVTRENTRADDHYIRSVSMTSADNQKQQYPSGYAMNDLLSGLHYLNATATAVFNVTAGQTYTPYIDYSTDWMHAYAYVDYNRDGEFTNNIGSDGYSLEDGSELVAYSAYSTDYTGGATGNWYNSAGHYWGNMAQGKYDCNTMTMPSFTIPSDLQSGLYRMRFKVDWCCLDAGGNDGSDGTNNQIWADGGGIVDVLLKVTGVDEVPVSASSYRNGTIWNDEGVQITSTALAADYNKPYSIVMSPANGFVSESITAIYKCNSTEYSGMMVNDTVTYHTTDAAYDATRHTFTLPAEMMYSEVSVEPMFNQAPVVEGDANGDGNINVADITATVNYLQGMPQTAFTTKNADMNGDGAITQEDVKELVKIMLGE